MERIEEAYQFKDCLQAILNDPGRLSSGIQPTPRQTRRAMTLTGNFDGLIPSTKALATARRISCGWSGWAGTVTTQEHGRVVMDMNRQTMKGTGEDRLRRAPSGSLSSLACDASDMLGRIDMDRPYMEPCRLTGSEILLNH